MADDTSQVTLQLLRAMLPGLHEAVRNREEGARREMCETIRLIERMEERAARGSHSQRSQSAAEGTGQDEAKSFGTEISRRDEDAYPPEAMAALERLAGMQHYHKRRNTILALVDARLGGRSEETVWRRGDTCSRAAWHGGWKQDALMQEVLTEVERAVRTWRDGEELRALRQASKRLALAAPRAAQAAEERMQSADETVALRAAFGILDRAGKETAKKAIVEISADDMAAARERAARYRRERTADEEGA